MEGEAKCQLALESSGTIKDKRILDIIELRKKIIRVLRENNGEMDLAEVCDLMKITVEEVPWGHNIGWSKCIQPNQKYYLILSTYHE